MGIRYAKSIKIGNLLKINISKSGVSATIGPKGASINVGSKGTYLNLSPTIAGISGTGVSYRKKLTGGYSSLVGKLMGLKDDKNDEVSEEVVNNKEIEEYQNQLETSICLHKQADNVLTVTQFEERINEAESDATKQIYELSKNGDEETIESLIGSFMSNLELLYEVKVHYELEDDALYVDLDLPEIECIKDEYPTIVKNQVQNKKKTSSMIKEEYANVVMSLAVYLSASFFNLSSYINKIIISGFTSKRNDDGDLTDEYLYSIKFTRDEFINTKLEELDILYDFILKFENRINYNASNYTFKTIKPYEMPSIEKANSAIEDAIAGLKELGYKNSSIQDILPQLNELQLQDSSAYLKEALKLLANKESRN